MSTCIACGDNTDVISEPLSVCVRCLREGFAGLDEHLLRLHRETRRPANLPATVPEGGSARCHSCVNECEIGEGMFGFCGVRSGSGERVGYRSGGVHLAYLQYYYDPLPTNCVAEWVCGGWKMGGMRNLAVFYLACSFNCLFCQNFVFRRTDLSRAPTVSDAELAERVTDDTGCICYFGGDPTPQMAHSLGAAKLALARKQVRVCWETNGSMSRAHLANVIDAALESGGIIKVDIKARSENLHRALCGASNRNTLSNLQLLGRRFGERRNPPLMVASTPLIPGYVDVHEITEISRLIAELDPEIPYSILGFHPQFHMDDLPTTSLEHAARAREAALGAGLKNVHIGNTHLLSSARYKT